MEVKLLKLVTGEEIIAQVEEDGEQYILKNPTKIGIMQEGVGLAPLSPFGKMEEITISKAHVIFTMEPEDEVKNGYNTQFGGIVVPPTGLNLVQ